MLNLEKELAEKYNLEVKNIAPYKDALIISTSSGKKTVKKNLLSQERIFFVYAAKEHLYKNGFKDTDRFLSNVDGKPFFTLDGINYTVSDAIDGVECNFDSRTDIVCATRALARMHKASKGFIAPENAMIREELGKIPLYFEKRLDEIKKLKKVAKRGKTKFDYLFLEHVDYFHLLGEKAIGELSSSNYEAVVKRVRDEKSFCHHDYTHHNIICDKEKTSIINFDFCCYELRVYDLANLIRRKMRKCSWSIDEAKLIVTEYRAEEYLSEEEMIIMKIILEFPQKFWRVVNKYYNSKRSWSEKSYISKLYEVIDEISYHSQFMQKFDELM